MYSTIPVNIVISSKHTRSYSTARTGISNLFLVYHSPTPKTTTNLRRRPQRQPNTVVPKKRRLSPRIRAQIEIDIRAVLVRVRETGLRT